jgi:hypothetical protein
MMHGFAPWVPDGKTLTAEDCPDCKLPTLVGEHYGMPYGPVRLDAMPVEVWETLAPTFGGHVKQYRGTTQDGHSLYTRHICPVRL